MARQPQRPNLPVPSVAPPYPPPIVIDVEAYPADPHPLPEPACPPPAPRRRKAKYIVCALAAAFAAIVIASAIQRQAADSPDQAADFVARDWAPENSDAVTPRRSEPALPWWAGTWVPQSGAATPRLELDEQGRSFSGQLTIDYVGGYDAVLPVSQADVGTDAATFAVESRRPQARPPAESEYYLLLRGRPQSCLLYRLVTPRVRPPVTGTLLPTDLDRHHNRLAELVRPGDPQRQKAPWPPTRIDPRGP